MRKRVRPRVSELVWLLLALMTLACGDNGTGPSPRALTLTLDDPVQARHPLHTAVTVLEFPLTIADPFGPGGTLVSVVTTVFNRTRGVVEVRNERPNAAVALPDRVIPAGGRLTVEAGAAFASPTPGEQLVVTVEVRLSDGRTAQRTAGVLRPEKGEERR